MIFSEYEIGETWYGDDVQREYTLDLNSDGKWPGEEPFTADPENDITDNPQAWFDIPDTEGKCRLSILKRYVDIMETPDSHLRDPWIGIMAAQKIPFQTVQQRRARVNIHVNGERACTNWFFEFQAGLSET